MPDAPEDAPGGVGDSPPGAADLNLIRRAIRQDWPIPDAVKRQLLQNVVNLVDPPEGAKVSKRTQLAAVKVLQGFGKLAVDQGKLDLAREKFEREKAASEAARPDRSGAPRIIIPGAEDGRA